MRVTMLLGVVGLLAALASPVLGQVQQPAKLSDKESKRVAELIGQLDSKKFPQRESAMKELDGFGERALELLEKAAKNPVSVEAQRRINQLIGKVRHNDGNRIAAIVQRLGDRRFQERQTAMMELEQIGRPALTHLYAARLSPEIEVARRADVLITRILKQAK